MYWSRAVLSTVVLFLAFGFAFAGHNQVTVGTLTASGNTISGTISVTTTINTRQDGILFVTVFEVDHLGVVHQLAFKDLGGVSFGHAVSGTSKSVTFSIDVTNRTTSFFSIFSTPRPLKGNFFILANFQSSVAGNAVAHTHASALNLKVE